MRVLNGEGNNSVEEEREEEKKLKKGQKKRTDKGVLLRFRFGVEKCEKCPHTQREIHVT